MWSVQKWDRSHLLENLSGYETDCAMVGRDDWPFTRVRTAAAENGMRLTAVFGSAPNEGSTDAALHRILENFKDVSIRHSNTTFRTYAVPCGSKNIFRSVVVSRKVAGGLHF